MVTKSTEQLNESTGLDKAAAIYLITRLNKRIENWEAYKLGLIDRNGKILRQPQTPGEIRALGILDRIILKIRRNLPSSVLLALSAYSVWKILAEEEIEENSLKPINETMAQILIEAVMKAGEQGISEKDALRWLLDRAESLDD